MFTDKAENAPPLPGTDQHPFLRLTNRFEPPPRSEPVPPGPPLGSCALPASSGGAAVAELVTGDLLCSSGSDHLLKTAAPLTDLNPVWAPGAPFWQRSKCTRGPVTQTSVPQMDPKHLPR